MNCSFFKINRPKLNIEDLDEIYQKKKLGECKDHLGFGNRIIRDLSSQV